MALSFQEDLQKLLNRHSAEAPSGTPDYILAEFLTEVLESFNETVGKRSEWRGESVELNVKDDHECDCANTTVINVPSVDVTAELSVIRRAIESAGIEIPSYRR